MIAWRRGGGAPVGFAYVGPAGAKEGSGYAPSVPRAILDAIVETFGDGRLVG